MLMKISEIIENYWWGILAFPFVLFFVFKAWGRTRGGRLTLDRLKLNSPLIGPIIKKSVISRFCRTLGTLLQSGVPILEALAIVKNATGNEVEETWAHVFTISNGKIARFEEYIDTAALVAELRSATAKA